MAGQRASPGNVEGKLTYTTRLANLLVLHVEGGGRVFCLLVCLRERVE